jgi:glycosyltransferase involved in cell wall biosynthesis
MNYPKITIVTPNFNGARFLEETLLSVLNQDYPNLEYIVIVGGSTYNSIDIIKKYENRLHFWLSEPDSGMYEAIQKGFDRSSGEIMGWLNSDDILHPKALFTLADIFANNSNVKWVEGMNTLVDIHSRIFRVQKPLTRYKFWYLTKDLHGITAFGYQQQESTYWRRSLWNKAGGKLHTDLKFAGDFELWMRFFNFAELYQVDTLIGGFRNSGMEQKSLSGANDYENEVNETIRKSISELNLNEQRKFKKYVASLKFYGKIPKLNYFLVNRFLKNYYKNKEVYFDTNFHVFKT